MKSNNYWGRAVLAAVLLVLAVAGTAFAQQQSGNLFGTVSDQSGAKLAGATVTLTGIGAPQTQVSDASGGFKFLSLAPGTYNMKVELQGFSGLDYPNIVINVGRNATIEATLSAQVEDIVNVTAESPLLDSRKIVSGATVSKTEMESIPTARDPWAILTSTPGVLTDRINVGGNESGQQATYVGKGIGGDQSVWAMDGVVITDMSATGSTPGYFDFDAFEEMQVTTGGADATQSTGGVILNMVTKRGTNQWRGSGRYYDTDKSRQSSTGISNSEFAKPGPWNSNRTQPGFTAGNRIVKVKDYGAELGGPIVKDRLWIWGSYAKPKISLLTAQNYPDVTTLEDYNGKLNAQITPSNSATVFYWQSNKVKIGRNAGLTRPPETTWDQGGFGDKPTTEKIEDTHIFNSNFYLTGMYSKVNGGFFLLPEGGDKAPVLDATTGIWHVSYLGETILRPQKNYKLDASSFFNTGTVSHELKYGVGQRKVEQTTDVFWPGGGPEIYNFGVPGLSEYEIQRDALTNVNAKYTSGYIQDTLTSGNLTANVGLRYDKQEGDNAPSNIAANKLYPNILGAVHYPGGPAGFSWTNVTPRLGLTYALGADRKTLLRASFSRFADQLATGTLGWLNPTGNVSYAYVYGPTRANGTIPGGFTLADVAYFSANVNPNTGGIIQSNGLSSNLSAPISTEVLFSVEHAVLPEFVLGLDLTYRRYSNLTENDLLVFDGDASSAANLDLIGRKATRADYVFKGNVTGSLPNGQTYSVPLYDLKPGVTTRGGRFLSDGDREQIYKGATFNFTKRLSHHWMMRGNISYADWKWNQNNNVNEDPTVVISEAIDGQQVLQGSGTGSGNKGSVYINSKWSYSINGMYQVAPEKMWGFNLAANLTGRQGYPEPFIARTGLNQRKADNGAGGRAFPVVTSEPDSFRFDDIRVLDLRVEKEFSFKDFGMTIGVDVFNATNESTVLERSLRLTANVAGSNQNQTTGNFVSEVLSPRVIRLGARFSFR